MQNRIENNAELKASQKVKEKTVGSRNDVALLHLMILPIVVLVFIYNYIPLFGVVIAFQKFNFAKGFFGSQWVGLDNYTKLLSLPETYRVLYNTISIALWKMGTMLIIPVVFSLLLNEVKHKLYKSTVQTVIYLPHFLSWVILAGILKNVFATDGMADHILQVFGIHVSFLGDKNIFPQFIIWTNVWKEFGFSTIVFLAAISGIDLALYEAAIIDGAGRWKQTWHVTLPGMRPIIILMFVLSLGGILNAGFDQIFNLYSVPTYQTGDIIDTLVYRRGIVGGQYSLGAAVGLFKSLVSFICVSLSYWMAAKFANYQIF